MWAAVLTLAEKEDPDGYEGGGEPAAPVDVFMEEKLGRNGIADIGKGTDGRGSERELGDAESEEHAEKVQCHTSGPGEEDGIAEDGANGSG